MARALLILVFAASVAQAEHRGPENFRLVAPGVYAGGAAEGLDWSRLAAVGVRTVVRVDGPPPDARAAAKIGARVVHIPIGYAGIDPVAAARLTRVARESPRPLYVACHHGRHRGPAAAAVVCRAAGLLDSGGAIEVLHRAGTDPKYAGLWKAVAEFQPPAPGAELPPLVEAADTPPLALAMSQLDKAWESWSEAPPAERERWRTVIEESLRESRRVAPTEMAAAFDDAVDTVTPLIHDRRAVADACVRCHTRHRDNSD